jgi:hypothetical protein
MLSMPRVRKSLKQKWFLRVLLWLGILVLLVLVLYQIPWIHQRAVWKLDAAFNYIRLIFHPVGTVPVPREGITPINGVATSLPQSKNSHTFSTSLLLTSAPTITPNPTSLPINVNLNPPTFDLSKDIQDWNNCGPATLALYLRFYGWQGDQFLISDLIKPFRGDKNVNIDELQYFVLTQAGWLGAEYRVGGTIHRLKQILAAGFPIMIEESFTIGGEDYWPHDDHWTGHYLLLTGYDDTREVFVSQDAYLGPDILKNYSDLDEDWQAFNRVYMVIFPTQQVDTMRHLLGIDWEKDSNRKHAMEAARQEIISDPENPFAWFNLGTNLAYFDASIEAAQAYDKALTIGIPQRMLRYQFGPFMVYFKLDRNEDLLSLTQFALNITPNSEEVLLWRGWALYRRGDRAGALEAIEHALAAHPRYSDALYALDFINTHP